MCTAKRGFCDTIGGLLFCPLARHGIDRLARPHLLMLATLLGMDGLVTRVKTVDDATGEKAWRTGWSSGEFHVRAPEGRVWTT